MLKKAIKNKIILSFNRDDALLLDEANLEVKLTEKGDNIAYTVRKILHAGMTSDIFLSPFEVIYLILSIRIQSITIFMDDIAPKNELDGEIKPIEITPSEIPTELQNYEQF